MQLFHFIGRTNRDINEKFCVFIQHVMDIGKRNQIVEAFHNGGILFSGHGYQQLFCCLLKFSSMKWGNWWYDTPCGHWLFAHILCPREVTMVNLGEKETLAMPFTLPLPFRGEPDIPEKEHVVNLRLKCFRFTSVNSVFFLVVRASILNPLAYKYVMLSTVYQMMKIFMYLLFLILCQFRIWLRKVNL